MWREVRVLGFSLLLAAGCQERPQQDVAAAPFVEPVPEKPTEPAPAPDAEKLLTPEKAPDLLVKPIPSGRKASPYSYPESYKPLHHGPTPAPTPIPVLPTRKPERILGDLRFLAAGSARGAVALSPDGKLLALGTAFFHTATGELHADFDSGGGAVHKVAFSPDGQRLYSSEGPLSNVPTHGNQLAIRDVPGRQQLLTISASDWGLSADGRLLATLESVEYDPHVGKEGPHDLLLYLYPGVRIYETEKWKGVAAYRVRTARPTSVALSPDGGRIVLGCEDGAVRIWDRTAGREVAVLRDLCETKFPTHKPVAHLITFSADGKSFAAANARPHDRNTPRQVAWWTWPDGKLLHLKNLDSYYDPTDLRFSPDGKSLFAGTLGGAVVFNTGDGSERVHFQRDRDRRTVPYAAFAAADRVYVPNAGRPALLKFPSLEPMAWPDRPFESRPPVPEMKTLEAMPPVENPMRDGRSIELPDGGRVRMLNWFETKEREAGFEQTDANGRRIRHYEAGRKGSFAVSPDGQVLVTSASALDYGAFDYAKWESPMRFWNLATGKELGVVRVYPGVGHPSFAFSPDGKRLAATHADGLIRLWDVDSRKPLLALDPDGWQGLDRLTFSTDGSRLVGGNARSPVLAVWDGTDPKK
jgi:WD40 repeat protein